MRRWENLQKVVELTNNSWTNPFASTMEDIIHQPLVVPLLDFNDVAWPLPDMSTSEAFRAKLGQDFLMSMKPTTRSKMMHISWFMPEAIMVDLFASASSIRRTMTLFVFKDISNELIDSLMDW